MNRTRWQNAGITVDTLTGEAIVDAIPDIAALRIAIFRAFPYLYDGDEEYERAYLADLGAAAGSAVVLARQGGRVIGAATGAPLAEVEGAWSAPFHARGLRIDTRFYCAESVLLEDWRGMGLGHAFFDAREKHARRAGMTSSCFCSVVRADDHPDRPLSYRPNDVFWLGRGYAPLDGITARFAWRDIGEPCETEKTLQFWERSL